MIVADPREVALDAMLAERGAVVVMAGGELRGEAAAVALFADFAILRPDATLVFDCAEAWAGVVWRLGKRALGLPESCSAAEALERGLCDAVSAATAEEWLARRSTLALDSAAMLVRSRGGDALERAEFARLFATGEPAEGLASFLQRRASQFDTIRKGRPA